MRPYNQLHGCEHHYGDHDRDDDGDDAYDHDHYFLLHQTSSVCGLGWTLAPLSSQTLVVTRQTEKFSQLSQLLHPPEITTNHINFNSKKEKNIGILWQVDGICGKQTQINSKDEQNMRVIRRWRQDFSALVD